MKKCKTKWFNEGFLHYPKFVRVLKLFLILAFIMPTTFASNAYSQTTKLSVNMSQATILDVFNYIESKTEFQIAYNNHNLDVMGKIDLKVNNKTVNEILDIILQPSNFKYVFIDKYIVITDKESDGNYKNQIKQNNINVSGAVTDIEGEAIPGITVIVKGTTIGTVTNIDGNYSLIDIPSNATLVFSFIGMKTLEVYVSGKTSIDIVMAEDAIGLEEVVAIGYGVVKKSDLTGSVGSIEADVIAATTITSAAGALQGRVAGVNIEKNVGRPGSGFQITIRGLSSINNSNGPLYVIDGIPTTSGLNDLNPNDIETINILKDASATAIYGSRGANGVVIVTTKKGKAGKISIQYDSYYGVRTPSNLPDMMNGEEYVQWRTDLYTNLGKSTDRSNADFFTTDEWGRIDKGEYTDWIDLMLQNGVQISNTITASGGDDKGTFALSFGQLKEEGTFSGQDFNRYNIRLNLNRKFSEKWEVGGNLYFTQSTQNLGSYETLRSTYRTPPVAYPYNENGEPKFFAYRNDFVTNPMFEYLDDGELRENRRYRAFGNLHLQFEPIKGLTIRSQLSPQMTYKRNGYYQGQYCKGGSGKIANTKASYSTSDYFSYVLDNQINYKKDIALHSFNLSVVQSIQYEQWEDSYQEAKNFPFNSKWHNLDAVTQDNIVASQTDYRQRSLASFLGRVQYSYASKYLFTLTGRYDGSSRLTEGNKWAFFPSAAFGWRISEEDFLKNFENLSNLKLRLSYGISGNDAVDIYGTQSNISQMNYDFDGTSTTAYYKNRLANYDLTWEKTYEINVGIDYGFFNNRINGSIDVYQRDAKDLIMKRQLPETSGWGSIWDNVGWVRNKGIEIGINSVNIQTDNFTWSTNIIFDSNKNEIIELYGEKKDDVGNGWFIGEPIQSNYDYQFDGIWQLDEADLAALYGQTPGQVKVKDLNDDKIIDSKDKKIIGQRTPKWSGSITNTLKYKNWDFSAYVYTRHGQQLYSTFKSTFMSLEGNYKNVDVDYWTDNNPTNKYPQPGNKGKYFNNFRYSDVSFVRVGNISLGYSIPKPALAKLNMSRLRCYFTMTNPFTFTSYEGFDPEWADQNTWGTATGYSTYLFGINLEL
ncbi:MAG: SusC/RagA family TonB-linked outer membrane protein [Bacteroidales bacterium]|nr:MAG: SusC/RagA family TonB-linked outer membrane protein [Bacteroidales bacterium]